MNYFESINKKISKNEMKKVVIALAMPAAINQSVKDQEYYMYVP